MSSLSEARRCTHILVTGHRCGSPALRNEYFCYFHARMIKDVPSRVDSHISPIALLENEESIQCALMDIVDRLLKGSIGHSSARLILKALDIAVRNSRRARFNIGQEEMVREVPNYAAQYLAEHPEYADTSEQQPAPAQDSSVTATQNNSAAAPLDPPPLTSAESRQLAEFGELEKCIDGALRGDLDDYKQVMRGVGLSRT